MKIRNPNEQHKESLNIHERLALKISAFVGSMWCAYLFALLALISLPEAIQGGTLTIISWIAQTFLQLVLLSIIMVSQNLQSRHDQMRAENDFNINVDADKKINLVLKNQALILEELKK